MAVKVLQQEEKWTGMLDRFMEELARNIEFESGSLFVCEADSQNLHEAAKSGEGIDFISSVSFPMGAGLSAWVAQKGKVIYLADIHRGSRHGLRPVRSYLSMPLETNNRVVGVLNLSHTEPNAFDGKRMETIEQLSKEVTRKIYNHKYLKFFDDEENDFTN